MKTTDKFIYSFIHSGMQFRITIVTPALHCAIYIIASRTNFRVNYTKVGNTHTGKVISSLQTFLKLELEFGKEQSKKRKLQAKN